VPEAFLFKSVLNYHPKEIFQYFAILSRQPSDIDFASFIDRTLYAKETSRTYIRDVSF